MTKAMVEAVECYLREIPQSEWSCVHRLQYLIIQPFITSESTEFGEPSLSLSVKLSDIDPDFTTLPTDIAQKQDTEANTETEETTLKQVAEEQTCKISVVSSGITQEPEKIETATNVIETTTSASQTVAVKNLVQELDGYLKDPLQAATEQIQKLLKALDKSHSVLGTVTEQCDRLQKRLDESEVERKASEREASPLLQRTRTDEGNHDGSNAETIECLDESKELEKLKEENERLKLELQACKETRPFSKTYLRESKSKLEEIRKDRLYSRLQLSKVDEADSKILADIIKELMLTLKLEKVDQLVPTIDNLDKTMRIIPQLREFINNVVYLASSYNGYRTGLSHSFFNYRSPALTRSHSANTTLSNLLNVPSEQTLKETLNTLSQWRDAVRDMETFATQLLQTSHTNWNKYH
ncbi:9631_t:CDS:2 [Paraglomus occultum]|uniref:9631_t:CDS:1 n=1 Tax=Paraglomus occultum TaxID=144539 RepID=A0A9N9CHZ3_9GLOM|nr:9631_t:CDS:2 [Paraglomus occultum]